MRLPLTRFLKTPVDDAVPSIPSTDYCYSRWLSTEATWPLVLDHFRWLMPAHRWLRETCTPARKPKGEHLEEDICRSGRPRHGAWNHNPDHASPRRLLQLREPEPGRQPGQRQLTSHRTDRLRALLSGEVVLVTEAGEEILRAGDCVGFRCATYPEITVSVGAGKGVWTTESQSPAYLA